MSAAERPGGCKAYRRLPGARAFRVAYGRRHRFRGSERPLRKFQGLQV